MQAADDLLQRQIEDGWVPYGGRPAMPDFVVPPPREAWIAAALGGAASCGRPPSIPAEVQLQCVHDAPDGTIIGYHISNVGFVPLDRVEDLDLDAAYERVFGCNPLLEPTCRERYRLENFRQMLADPELTADERRLLEHEIDQLEREIERLEASG
jgi:hypothetical protein